MKVFRKIIEIDEERCDGCGQCVPDCAEGALEIVDGKARVIAEKYCDGLGACLNACPQNALKIVERQAEDFDEEAVEVLLAARKGERKQAVFADGGGCPSAVLQNFPMAGQQQVVGGPPADGLATASAGALSHWPVQIRLVPPGAPFLQGADLLVAADCTPVAYPEFHRDFLQSRKVLMGCPKFDDQEGYVSKFTEIFSAAGIKSVTMLIMEVPCCGSMSTIISKALQNSGKELSVEQVVVSCRGEILRREMWQHGNKG